MEVFRYPDGSLPNSLALAYITVTFPLSLWGLSASTGAGYFLWCLLLAHALIISAYLVHECLHNTLFKNSRHNKWLGQILAWITGAAYTPYDILQKKHLRHHADRVDVLAIDYRHVLRANPRLTILLISMQHLYLPATEILTHGLSIISPFLLESRRHLMPFVMLVLLSRVLFFMSLAYLDLGILPGYLLSYLVFLWVLGFMDTFQHRYEVRLQLDEAKVLHEFDRDYEETHTFSNLLSQRFPVLNLLVLNFCYHNAHHYKSGTPWYELPKIHAERYKHNAAPIISFYNQSRNYHRYRTARLLDTLPANTDVGAAGVSFLVGV